ncbi:hypothetical protein MMC34_002010 [Xylographa carneopallida]|nr:hypothetical protein [Xylographa carneopallida]
MLLSKGYSLHETDQYRNQPLHYAAGKPSVGIIDLLLKNGADVNARGAEGKTPLHLALRSTQAVNRLLREHPPTTAHDDNENTVLHTAVAAAFEALNSAMMFPTIKSLVRYGYDVNRLNSVGQTAFHIAIRACSSTSKVSHLILILLLENKANVSLPDSNSKMPFQTFLDRMDKINDWNDRICQLVQLFLLCGADPNTVSEDSPLLHAILMNLSIFHRSYHANALAKSLCETADLNKLADNGDTPLHIIARKHSLRDRGFTVILLRRGANPDQTNKFGDTLLTLLSNVRGAFEGIISMMVSLIQAGANPMKRDGKGILPVYHAFWSNKKVPI